MVRRGLLLALLLFPLLAAAHDHYPFSFLKPNRTNDQFVDRSFRTILNRPPSAGERAEWLDVLGRGSSRWYLVQTLLDSSVWHAQVSDEKAVVLCFRAVVQRPPTLPELQTFQAWLAQGGARSDVFRALVMSRDFALRDLSPFYLMDDVELRLHPALVLDLDTVLQSVRAGGGSAFVETVAAPAVEPVRDSSAQAEASGLRELSGGAWLSAYQDYRGYLHAHSYLSVDARDKGGSPDEAWTMARDQAHLDYMGITDHAEFLGAERWQQLRDAATRFNQPGVFVGLPGFEHSNPAMGHFCVMNTTDIRSALEKTTVSAFYDWLENQPQAVVTFNHPGSYDWAHVEFNHFALRTSVVPMLVASEVMHSSLDQYMTGYGGEIPYVDEAIQKGWRVGAVQAQDNHSKNYGIANDTRTVAFAADLTVDGLLEAYRSRRTYASEDKNLYLTFATAEGHEMGSVLDRGARSFRVGLDDPDTETFTKIEVYQDGQVAQTQDISTTAGTWAFDLPAADHDRYLYVRVTQQDGDRAQSSPIWLTTAATGTVGVRN